MTFTKLVNDDKQIHAEVLHTNFIVQNNISSLNADHLAPLYHVMFSIQTLQNTLDVDTPKLRVYYQT